jgi:hypothetical protein
MALTFCQGNGADASDPDDDDAVTASDHDTRLINIKKVQKAAADHGMQTKIKQTRGKQAHGCSAKGRRGHAVQDKNQPLRQRAAAAVAAAGNFHKNSNRSGRLACRHDDVAGLEHTMEYEDEVGSCEAAACFEVRAAWTSAPLAHQH